VPTSKVTGGHIDDRLRPKEAAQIAHVSVGTINNWWQAGYFESWVVVPRDKDRGVRYIDGPSFYAFLESLPRIERSAGVASEEVGK
jgi:hypothetical protein